MRAHNRGGYESQPREKQNNVNPKIELCTKGVTKLSKLEELTTSIKTSPKVEEMIKTTFTKTLQILII